MIGQVSSPLRPDSFAVSGLGNCEVAEAATAPRRPPGERGVLLVGGRIIGGLGSAMFDDRRQTTDHVAKHEAFWLGFSVALFGVVLGGMLLLRSFG